MYGYCPKCRAPLKRQGRGKGRFAVCPKCGFKRLVAKSVKRSKEIKLVTILK